MLCSIFENVIASAISAIVIAYIKRFVNRMKTFGEMPLRQKRPPRAFIKKQFFISLTAMAVLFTVSAALPDVFASAWLGFLRFILFIANGYAIIFAWGAFDAAFEFYPPDESTGDAKANQSTDKDGT